MNVKYFEYTCRLSAIHQSFRLMVIYRPPNCGTTDFFMEFSDLLEGLSGFRSLLLISGDVNMHMIWINLRLPVYPSKSTYA